MVSKLSWTVVLALLLPVAVEALSGHATVMPQSIIQLDYAPDYSWPCDSKLESLFIPIGQNSIVLVKDELPVKASISQLPPPAWWAKPFVVAGLRIAHVQTSTQSAPPRKAWKLPHILPQGDFCKWWILTFNLVPPGFCRDCSQRACNIAADVVPGSPDYRVEMPWPDALSSGVTPTVCLDTLPPGASSITVSWEDWHLDPSVFICLLVGIFLMSYYVVMRESPTFHAALGGVCALVIWSICFAWWILRNVKKTATGVPIFGGLFSFSFLFAFTAFPSLRTMMNPFRSFDVFKNWLVAFLSLQDPLGYHLPIGWILAIVFVFVALISIHYGAKWSMNFFASAPEPNEVSFKIGADGRRIDILPPPPLQQRFLGLLIWLSGVIFVWRSTYCTKCSLIVLVIVYDIEWLVGLFSRLCQVSCSKQMSPEDLRTPMSLHAYEKQKSEYTMRAIQRLREHIRSHTGVYALARDDQSELRLRRFIDSGMHVRQEFPEWDDSAFSQRAYSCAIL